MAQFLAENLQVIRFAYGLIFFVLGFAIVLQPRRDSDYFLSTALSWLAAFALIHAFADWGLVFIPMSETPTSGPNLIQDLLLIRRLGVIVSFGFLLRFGLSLWLEQTRYRIPGALVPALVTAAMVMLQLLSFYAPTDSPWWIVDMRAVSRYLLGFPAAMFSAWGLVSQVAVLKREKMGQYVWHLYGAAACFVLYGIAAGLVVPDGQFFPANTINETAFFKVFQVPVEVARSATMAGVTYFMVRLLDIFHLETERRMRTLQEDRALLRERERIARELHDGIMQTLYGAGLGIKQVVNSSCQRPEQAQEILTELNREIGKAIVQMRRFVLDLKETTISPDELAAAVQGMATEVGHFAGIRVHFNHESHAGPGFRIPAGFREEVLHVVREGLSNVVRHSKAEESSIMLALDDDTVLVRISDSGKGFDPGTPTTGRGLDSLRERVEALGGYFQVLSDPGVGTQLVAHLPLSPRRPARRKETSA